MHNLRVESDSTNYSDFSSDSDICDSNEIIRLFIDTDSISETVVANNQYILNIDATSESEPKVAAALTDSNCEIIQLNNQQAITLTTLKECKGQIIDCKFSRDDHNLLFIGFNNGAIKLWDIRIPSQSVINFLDSTNKDGSNKTFNCFDVSSNERLLAAGTELYEGDAFLIFWDIRNHELLGGYWESHTDDITQVKFHPEDKDKLVSGSTDGLINIYDLSQQCEDDALLSSLNTQSSVDHLHWIYGNPKNTISCITHTSDLQLWNIDGAEPYKHLTRTDIARGLKKKSDKYTYIENVHNGVNDLLVLAGSNFGDGECLRGLQIKNGKIEYGYNFKCNKQRVRCSWFNPYKNILLTGGEKGILNMWSPKFDKCF